MVHFTFAHTFFDDKTNKSEVTRDFVVAVVVGVTRNGAPQQIRKHHEHFRFTFKAHFI